MRCYFNSELVIDYCSLIFFIVHTGRSSSQKDDFTCLSQNSVELLFIFYCLYLCTWCTLQLFMSQLSFGYSSILVHSTFCKNQLLVAFSLAYISFMNATVYLNWTTTGAYRSVSPLEHTCALSSDLFVCSLSCLLLFKSLLYDSYVGSSETFCVYETRIDYLRDAI